MRHIEYHSGDGLISIQEFIVDGKGCTGRLFYYGSAALSGGGIPATIDIFAGQPGWGGFARNVVA